MQAGTHHIRSQRWQIRTTSTATAFAVRQELRTQLDTLLLPAFERAFDAFTPDDEVLHIPSLTLHLQLREGSNLTAELVRLIEAELSAALRAVVRTPATKDDTQSLSAVAGIRATPLGAQALSAVVGTPATLHGAQALSAAEHRRVLLVEYLASGRIGWQADTQETSSLLTWLKGEAELLATEQQSLEKLITGTFETRLAMSFRLLQLLAPSTRETLLPQRAAGQSVELVAILRQLASRQALGSFLQLRVAALLLTLCDADLSVTETGTVQQLLADCCAKLAGSSEPDASLVRAVDSLLGRTNSDASTHGGPAALLGHIPTAHAPTAALQTTEQGRSEVMYGVKDRSSAPDDVVWRVTAIEPAAASQRPGLLVGDAGVILLHPFLPRLLEATGIADATSRNLPAARLPRAAALLHWLATGREEVFEFELSLTKVLLGLTPTDSLVVAGGLLSDNDRAEGNALLVAVVEHWTALRNTSVAGLRVSFLQRRGLLRDDDRGWWLRVEAESFDLLLGQLPWGISFVKLPWMTKPIFTDWPTP